MEKTKGTLYVVGVPIGNLGDITLRALEVLKSVEIIVSEDTRSVKKLLTHYGCGPKKLISLYKEVEVEKTYKVLKLLEEAKDVVFTSEAGCPLISDPGAYLVKEAHKRGVKVVPVPGVSSLTCALSVSGVELTKGFIFLGFLPRKKTEQKKVLENLPENLPIVIFESPHRMGKTVKNLLEILGNRECFLARELTKLHEELLWTDLETLAQRENFLGEITLIILPRTDKEESVLLKKGLSGLKKRIRELKKEGLKPKEIAKILAEEYNIPAKEVYQLITEG
ncbi:16S rRNA (cytidine(1402)-2'-O)-methyltransferase [Thermodesulfobacterium sp. TA1]|uniref:16S rRNA (cytidine(1402)-2'-O)-methyltransferase n=1 Tax=Thermodesulfobacterium sp. TA1 TaxID=2234087 RepID=UPI001231DD9C|nr:16S rRNA (cytidine(1402)-2'-O)-methyltransferase [Thermodesulfobacterium sp. TA1]QER42560.1 16S rRNA (cytidine(1402)-2'-O)-methyltransferase [Thermodesulfobacterium sp. TA1]